jgi:glycosyltransferase involved in cell wall biosynthesis
MRKILIINKSPQFGYHTPYLFFCRYLKTDFDITYISMDFNKKKIDFPNIKIEYVQRNKYKIFRTADFYSRIFKTINSGNYDIILIHYFNSCSLLRILYPSKCFILDIRTTAIKNSFLKRYLWNLQLRYEAKLFSHITVLSDSLARKTDLKDHQYHLLPLGAEEISAKEKEYNQMNLLYVGAFVKRNIHDTIEGLYYFYKDYSDKITITYTIIGFGTEVEMELINKTIQKYNLESIVNYAGQIPYSELKGFFDRSNIGVSYVPITAYFDCQPPTKTFEYIMSGLYCISTDTAENRRIIRPENGVLCKDTPASFCEALKEIYTRRTSLNDQTIRTSLPGYKWESIVNDNFKTYLKEMLHD